MFCEVFDIKNNRFIKSPRGLSYSPRFRKTMADNHKKEFIQGPTVISRADSFGITPYTMISRQPMSYMDSTETQSIELKVEVFMNHELDVFEAAPVYLSETIGKLYSISGACITPEMNGFGTQVFSNIKKYLLNYLMEDVYGSHKQQNFYNFTKDLYLVADELLRLLREDLVLLFFDDNYFDYFSKSHIGNKDEIIYHLKKTTQMGRWIDFNQIENADYVADYVKSEFKDIISNNHNNYADFNTNQTKLFVKALIYSVATDMLQNYIFDEISKVDSRHITFIDDLKTNLQLVSMFEKIPLSTDVDFVLFQTGGTIDCPEFTLLDNVENVYKVSNNYIESTLYEVNENHMNIESIEFTNKLTSDVPLFIFSSTFIQQLRECFNYATISLGER